MTDDMKIFDAALETYLARATPDAEWIDLYRESTRKLLGELTAPERERLMSYINRFSVLNASFIVRRLCEVYAVSLYATEDEVSGRARKQTAAANLRAFHRDFIDPPIGEEEGKRPAEAPQTVFKAALRRVQGCDDGTPPAFREMTATSIGGVMATFSRLERDLMEEQFERFSVEAMVQVLRLWMWHQGEESRRAITPRQQYEQWHKTGDESYWWRYPQGEQWIYF